MWRFALLGTVLALLVGLVAVHPGLRRATRSVLEQLGVVAPYQQGPRYQAILGRHREENGKLPEGCLVLFGDSLTEAFPASITKPRGWFSRGISGDRARDLQARLAVSALETPCPAVALLVGSNDLVNDGAEPADVAEQIASIVGALQTAGKQVLLTTVPPTRGAHAGANPAIRELNDRLRAITGPDVRLVDLHGAVRDATGSLAEPLSQDGLHLAPPAYRLWAERLEQALGPEATPGVG